MKFDPFTARRLTKFIEDYRARTGQLPTLRDLESGGFAPALIEQALKEKKIEKFYVTLTNGTVVKGYKVSAD